MGSLYDKLGRDLSPLRDKKLFIFDMDGTIYTDGVLYEGALNLMHRIHELGGDYVFFTNNSSKSVAAYIERVSGMGIVVDASNFCTSLDAAAHYLLQYHPNNLVWCMGTASFVTGLRMAGVNVTTDSDVDASVVLVGYDTELTYDKLRDACRLLSLGATWLATNCDIVCPTSFGFVPDCGSLCAMLTEATGRKPTYLGKPEPFMVEEAMRRFDATPAETVVVGDRLYTDIASGINAGVDSVCVLTGEATYDDARESDYVPTYIIESVLDLYRVLTGFDEII